MGTWRMIPARWWLVAAVMAVMGLGGIALLNPARASTNLVQDGTFSLTSLSSPGGYLCSTTGSNTSCASALTDWGGTCSKSGCNGTNTPASLLMGGLTTAFNKNNNSPGVYWNGGSISPNNDGTNVVAIDGDSNYSSSITQSIMGLAVGASYTLQFYQASTQEKNFTGATTEYWTVSLGSSQQQSPTMNTASASYTNWVKQTMTFVATATSETLTFAAGGTPGNEPPVVLLGDVSLTQNIPEPASVGLFGAGVLAMVGLLARRRGARRRYGDSVTKAA